MPFHWLFLPELDFLASICEAGGCSFGIPWWLSIKESVYNAGDVGSIPELGRSPEEENDNPLQYSCLGDLMNRAAWWAAVHGVAKGQAWLSDWTPTKTRLGICYSSLSSLYPAGLPEFLSPHLIWGWLIANLDTNYWLTCSNLATRNMIMWPFLETRVPNLYSHLQTNNSTSVFSWVYVYVCVYV